MDIPTGYAPLARTSPVLDLLGPLYSNLSLAFANCHIDRGGQRIVRASAVFLVAELPGAAKG
ncbi:MAG: hypothetical protein EPO01_11525 [Aquabacterium sp.]|nr:MAG: hypothetical protein EPO01_11525 [Aquabacterium sp.]